MENNMGWLDYLIFGALLLMSAFIGIYFGKKKQNTTDEYLLGGKSMGVFPISMSLIGSYVSGIAMLGVPAEMYVYGTQYWMVIVPEFLVSLTMIFVFIPVFYTLQITSSYEYLHLRFSKRLRTFGSCLFIILMFSNIPIVTYVPTLALSQVMGIKLHVLAYIVCAVCIFYTIIGGLQAVVWTDTLQVVMMLTSSALVLVIGTVQVGGPGEVIARNRATGRIEFDTWNPDPRERHSVWGILVGYYFHWLAACSANQIMVQRCLTMSSRSKANLTVIFQALGTILILSMSCYTGLVVFAHFYKCDPITTKQIKKPDQILPYFVMEVASFVPGLPGLFVSGVFSAALSTMSSGLNSMACVIYQDLMRPLIKRPQTELNSSFVVKVITLLLGILCVVLVLMVDKLGALIQAANSLGGIISGPLLGLFSLGMFFPWANEKGALVGGLSGLAVTGTLSMLSQVAIARGQIRYRTKPFSVEDCEIPLNFTLPEPTPHSEEALWILQISYMWYSIIGVTTVLSVGMLVSYITGFNDPKEVPRDLLTPVIHRFLPKKKQTEEVKDNDHDF